MNDRLAPCEMCNKPVGSKILDITFDGKVFCEDICKEEYMVNKIEELESEITNLEDKVESLELDLEEAEQDRDKEYTKQTGLNGCLSEISHLTDEMVVLADLLQCRNDSVEIKDSMLHDLINLVYKLKGEVE